MSKLKVPLCVADIGEEELQAMREATLSGWLTEGPSNRELEAGFAKLLGVEHAVSCNSGTAALMLALMAKGIRGEVIVPSFTFVASVNAIVVAGATPVFVDVHFDTGNLDAGQLESLITPRTEAILAVHFAGHAARLDELVRIADRHGLALIEDCAESLGGKFRGQLVGSFGTGCFSFYPSKNMTTGEGGMLVTRDDAVARRARSIAAHGIEPLPPDRFWYRSTSFPGFNFRLSNVLAAMGVVQLRKLASMNLRRRGHAAAYNSDLKQSGVTLPVEQPDCEHVYQMYTVKVDALVRDAIVSGLRERGVGASVHFDPPAHLQYYYRERYLDVSLPVTEKLARSILTLPLYPGMTAEQRGLVAEALSEELRRLQQPGPSAAGG